jgi:hypothetical protein
MSMKRSSWIGYLSGLGLNIGNAPVDRRANGEGLAHARFGTAAVELGQLALQGLKSARRRVRVVVHPVFLVRPMLERAVEQARSMPTAWMTECLWNETNSFQFLIVSLGSRAGRK